MDAQEGCIASGNITELDSMLGVRGFIANEKAQFLPSWNSQSKVDRQVKRQLYERWIINRRKDRAGLGGAQIKEGFLQEESSCLRLENY